MASQNEGDVLPAQPQPHAAAHDGTSPLTHVAASSDAPLHDSSDLEYDSDSVERPLIPRRDNAEQAVITMPRVDSAVRINDNDSGNENASDSDDALLGLSDDDTALSSHTSRHHRLSSAALERLHRLVVSIRNSPLLLSRRTSDDRQQASPPQRRRSRRHRRRCFKRSEQNYGAAVCGIITAVCLSCALLDTSWFTLRGGGCRDALGAPINKLGVFTFMNPGKFDTHAVSGDKHHVIEVYRHGNSVMIDCVTPEMVEIIHTIIALCLLCFVMSIIAVSLDLLGPNTTILKYTRRHAIIGILVVIFCVTILGFSFLVTEILHALQEKTKDHHYSKVEIHFSSSFYLITTAGAIAIIGCAFNLLRRPSHRCRHSSSANHMHRSRELSHDWLMVDDDSGDYPIGIDYTNSPPPPYTA